MLVTFLCCKFPKTIVIRNHSHHVTITLQLRLHPCCKIDGRVSITCNAHPTWLICVLLAWVPLSQHSWAFSSLLSTCVHNFCIPVDTMGPERSKYCDLCQHDIKPCGNTTHHKACEKKAKKQQQNQHFVDSIQRNTATGMHIFSLYIVSNSTHNSGSLKSMTNFGRRSYWYSVRTER
jgi:hypothetical protein